MSPIDKVSMEEARYGAALPGNESSIPMIQITFIYNRGLDNFYGFFYMALKKLAPTLPLMKKEGSVSSPSASSRSGRKVSKGGRRVS